MIKIYNMNEFERLFYNERKALNLKQKDVADLLNITTVTLKSRLRNPESFKYGELEILKNRKFNLDKIWKKIRQ